MSLVADGFVHPTDNCLYMNNKLIIINFWYNNEQWSVDDDVVTNDQLEAYIKRRRVDWRRHFTT